MKLISWNVNGYRAILKKGFFDFMKKEKSDILALQETKASIDQLKEKDYTIENYFVEFNSAEKKGYSGTAIFSKQKPKSFKTGMGISEFDNEGRMIHAEYEDFHFINCYFPNGGMGPERIKYKLEFYEAFLDYIEELRKQKKPVIFCGDVNTAHNEIDLASQKKIKIILDFSELKEIGWIK